MRESPAIEIMEELVRRGAQVRYTDPFVPSVTIRDGRLQSLTLGKEMLQWCEATLILTDHKECCYADLVVEAPLVVDSRNATCGLDAPHERIARL